VDRDIFEIRSYGLVSGAPVLKSLCFEPLLGGALLSEAAELRSRDRWCVEAAEDGPAGGEACWCHVVVGERVMPPLMDGDV